MAATKAQAQNRNSNAAGDGPVAAVLVPRGRSLVADRLFERQAPIELKLAKGGAGKQPAGKPGDIVLLDLTGGGSNAVRRARRSSSRGPSRTGAAIVKRIGRVDVAADLLEALMLENGLSRRFDKAVNGQAREAAGLIDIFPRRDLTDLPTFTMDPESAKDYDDAVSAQKQKDGIRVWVHIADVSAFVRPGDAVDSEALKRGTSTYVPGAVEPMLPPELSNEACSLVPGKPRQVVTAEILMRGDEPVSASFYRATIRSDARLTYGQVDEIFAGKAQAEDPWAAPLELARKIGGALNDKRKRLGALEVDSREPSFEFDKAGRVKGMHQEIQTESHRVVEHLMILANEQVAGYLQDKHQPGIYRVHERPDPESIEFLVDQLASLGVPTPPIPKHFTGQEAADLVGHISVAVAKEVRKRGHGRAALTSLVLRSLKMAIYSTQNVGHSGLRSPRYCHFTSPIRRYPDLVVHRALLGGLGVDDVTPTASELDEIAMECSLRERESVRIERKADDICRALLLIEELNQGGADRPFEAEVTGMVGGGLFVAFGDELQYEGFLPVRTLKSMPGFEGRWDLNVQATAMLNGSADKAVRLGDPLAVKVDSVEPARGRTDLLPVRL